MARQCHVATANVCADLFTPSALDDNHKSAPFLCRIQKLVFKKSGVTLIDSQPMAGLASTRRRIVAEDWFMVGSEAIPRVTRSQWCRGLKFQRFFSRRHQELQELLKPATVYLNHQASVPQILAKGQSIRETKPQGGIYHIMTKKKHKTVRNSQSKKSSLTCLRI